jgi:Matrixin
VARFLLTLTLTAALLAPVPAEAQHRAAQRGEASKARRPHASARRAVRSKLAARDPVALATTIGERYWGEVPCRGEISVRAEQPLAAGLDSTTDGWATFESSLGANDLQAPASTYTDCTISLARWQWPTRVEMASDWNMFCLTVIHELGHLLGHPHSLTPGSVMAPVFTDESSVPAICRNSRVGVEAVAGRSRAR